MRERTARAAPFVALVTLALASIAGVLLAAPPPGPAASGPAASGPAASGPAASGPAASGPTASVHKPAASAPAPGAASAPAAGATLSPLALAWRGEPVRLRAARLSVDLGARRAELQGNVELHRRDAVLRCPQLSLTFDAQGQVTTAVATGGITLDAGELHAAAHEARFDGGPQLVRLLGAVQAHQGGLRLTAAAATIDLARQQLDLSEVEGVAGPR